MRSPRGVFLHHWRACLLDRRTSLEKQMAARIDGEMSSLPMRCDQKGCGTHRTDWRRQNVLNLEYLLVDANGTRVTGDMPVTPTISAGVTKRFRPTVRQRCWADLAILGRIGQRHALIRCRRLRIDRRHASRVARSRRMELDRVPSAECSGWIVA